MKQIENLTIEDLSFEISNKIRKIFNKYNLTEKERILLIDLIVTRDKLSNGFYLKWIKKKCFYIF